MHGMIDVIEKADFSQNTICPQKVPSFINFSGLVGQPVAQGALELNCSFLQLKHNRTSLLWCDRKELRLFPTVLFAGFDQEENQEPEHWQDQHFRKVHT